MKPRHLHIDVQPHGRRHARLACYDGPPTAEGRCAPLGRPWSVRADMVDAVVAWLRRGAQLDGVPVTVAR